MKDRFRLFQCILYPDTNTYDFKEVLRNLKSFREWAYILHDKDLKTDDTDTKKAHIHFLLHLDNAMTISALSKKTGIPENYIQNVRNERSMCRYLLHIDDEDKFQYDINDVKVSGQYERYFKKCFDDLETDDIIIGNIFSYINDLLSKHYTYSELLFNVVKYVNTNCYDRIYKRYRFEINEYIKLNL